MSQLEDKVRELSVENTRLVASNNRYIKSNQALATKNARLSERILDAEDEIRRLVEERTERDPAFVQQEANGHA